MTNKTRAIVDANRALRAENRALRAENRALWARNEELERGAEEAKAIYEALTMQLVMEAGGSVTLAKTDVKALTKRRELRVERNADGSMTLTLKEREAEND